MIKVWEALLESILPSPERRPFLLGLLLLGDSQKDKCSLGLRSWAEGLEEIANGFLLEGTVWKSRSGEGSIISISEDLPMDAGWQAAPGTS